MIAGASVLIRPGKLVGRFSKKELTPSAASALFPSSNMARESARCASHGDSASSMDHSICRDTAPEPDDVLSTISCAISAGDVQDTTSGRTREIQRPLRHLTAGNTRAVV